MVLVDYLGMFAVSTDCVKVEIEKKGDMWYVGAASVVVKSCYGNYDGVPLTMYGSLKDTEDKFYDMLNHLEAGDKVYYFS